MAHSNGIDRDQENYLWRTICTIIIISGEFWLALLKSCCSVGEVQDCYSVEIVVFSVYRLRVMCFFETIRFQALRSTASALFVCVFFFPSVWLVLSHARQIGWLENRSFTRSTPRKAKEVIKRADCYGKGNMKKKRKKKKIKSRKI